MASQVGQKPGECIITSYGEIAAYWNAESNDPGERGKLVMQVERCDLLEGCP